MSSENIRENFDIPGCSVVCDAIKGIVKNNIDKIKESVPADTKKTIEDTISDSIKGQTFEIDAKDLVADDQETIDVLRCLIPPKN